MLEGQIQAQQLEGDGEGKHAASRKNAEPPPRLGRRPPSGSRDGGTASANGALYGELNTPQLNVLSVHLANQKP